MFNNYDESVSPATATIKPGESYVIMRLDNFFDPGQINTGSLDMTISGNVIENTTTTLSRGFNGMDLQFGNGWTVAGNSIHLDLGIEALGIYVRKGVSEADSRSRIVNNEIRKTKNFVSKILTFILF